MISFNIILSHKLNVSQVVFLPSSFPLKPTKAPKAVMLLYFILEVPTSILAR